MKSITKRGATENQGQVVNSVETEFAILGNSLRKSNTNTKSFISLNNTGDAPSPRARGRCLSDTRPSNRHAPAYVRADASVCPRATVISLQWSQREHPNHNGGGTISWFELSDKRCAGVLGDDESILQAVPQISQIQRWHGLKQQGLCVPPRCLQRQSRHLLCNAPLRYLRADRSLVPNASEDFGFLVVSQLGLDLIAALERYDWEM